MSPLPEAFVTNLPSTEGSPPSLAYPFGAHPRLDNQIETFTFCQGLVAPQLNPSLGFDGSYSRNLISAIAKPVRQSRLKRGSETFSFAHVSSM